MEPGALPRAGRDPKTGQHYYPKLELTRLAIPRRVYTQAHMDVVAESVKAVYAQRAHARGLRMVYEPRYLRFFQARFEPIRTYSTPSPEHSEAVEEATWRVASSHLHSTRCAPTPPHQRSTPAQTYRRMPAVDHRRKVPG
jgi:hypothetical protein